MSLPALVDIACLGQFYVLVNGQAARFATDHGRALLSYLAVEADRPHTRVYIAYMLWPDQPESQALNNLRQTLTRLRQTLNTASGNADTLEPQHSAALTITARSLQLNSDAVALDVRQFRELIAESKAHTHLHIEQCSECIHKLENAISLYKGEFLQGLSLRHSQPFAEWASYIREELHQMMIFALQAVAQHHEQRGSYAEARRALARLLALEPWQEDAHLQMIRVLAKSGQRSAAILQYETCRRVLQEELGIAPSAQINALYAQIRNDTFGREREISALLPDPSQTMRAQGDELPGKVQLIGRTGQLAQLKEWLIYQQSQVITVWGMGGMGKTALTAATVEAVTDYYDVVLWRSLLNASSAEDLLRDCLISLRLDDSEALPEEIDAQLALLLHHLRTHRCLLILDNLESILNTDQAGVIHPDFVSYTQLFLLIAETQHKSCLLLTSREQLQIISTLEEKFSWIHSLHLDGLDANAAQILLAERNLALETSQAAKLVERYSGNPLALKLVAETIQEIFGGKIDGFLASQAIFFDDIRSVLEEQFLRLPTLEQDVLLWFAVEREPLSLETLTANLSPMQPTHQVVQAVRALQRRSLLLHTTGYAKIDTSTASNKRLDASFVIPNVLMEYLVERLVQEVSREIVEESPHRLHTHALMQAQAKEYVRQSQFRLMLLPIANHLETHLGREGVRRKVKSILATIRKQPFPPRSYAAGSLLNLLIALNLELDDLDLAGLTVWQADLRHASMVNVNLSGADLTRSRFADAFAILYCVTVSPDGKTIAAGSINGEIRLWDAESGNLRYVYRGHRGPVRSIAFSPDGNTLASGGEDTYVRLWSTNQAVIMGTSEASPMSAPLSPWASTNRVTHPFADPVLQGDGSSSHSAEFGTPFCRILRGHSHRVLSIDFHPNGNMLASSSLDQTVRLWDVMSGETRAVLHEHEQPVWSISFSVDGKILASGDATGLIYLWDSQRAELQRVLNGHVAMIHALTFDPKGRWLASSSHDAKIIIWDLQSGSIHKTLEPSQDGMTGVAFSPDGSIFATSGDDQMVYVINTETWRILYPLRLHDDAVTDIVFSPNGQTLISAGADHLVCIWDLQTLRIRHRLSGYSKRLNTLAFHPSGKYLASGHYDHGIRLWDLSTHRIHQTIYGHAGGTNSLTFSADGTLLASANDDHSIHLWEMSPTGERPNHFYRLLGHGRDVTGVTFYQDKNQEGVQRLLSSSEDRRIGIWDLEFHQLSSFMSSEHGPLWSVQINAAGTLIAAIDDNNIHLWNMPEGDFYKELRGHTRFIWSLAFSPDNKLLACGGNDGTIALWDVHDPAHIKIHRVLSGHTDRVFVVAISPDGNYLACGSADHTITIWNLQTYELIHRLRAHTHWVWTLAFSPDGQTLASGGWDEIIYLWHVASGQVITALSALGPYAGMDISGVTGLNEAERVTLKQLGAIEK